MLNLASTAFIAIAILALGYSSAPSQQREEDLARPVARITDHRGRESTIFYRDVMTHLALQPGTPLDPPVKADLEAGLQRVIAQRIIETAAVEEAVAFGWQPSEEAVDRMLKETFAYFSSPKELEARVKQAGFYSLRDENLRNVFLRSSAINWYVDIHFRGPARPTREIEERYYREVFAPDFRRRNPAIILPTLDEMRGQISEIIINEGARVEVEKHLKRARLRVRIEMLEGAFDDSNVKL